MGYTHYWYLNRNTDQKKYEAALAAAAIAVREYRADLSGGFGELGQAAPIAKGCIFFNGIGDQSHETFVLRPAVRDLALRNPDDLWLFDCCKTAGKAYDYAVMVVLVIMKMKLGKDIQISSDGGLEEWLPALNDAACLLDEDNGLEMEELFEELVPERTF